MNEQSEVLSGIQAVKLSSLLETLGFDGFPEAGNDRKRVISLLRHSNWDVKAAAREYPALVKLGVHGKELFEQPTEALQEILDLNRVISTLQTGYQDRLEWMYLVSCPRSLKAMWGIVDQFIALEVRKKLEFAEEKVIKDLKEIADLEEVERRFGGVAEDRTSFWPLSIPPIARPSKTAATAINPDPIPDDSNRTSRFLRQTSSMETLPKIEFDPNQLQEILLPSVSVDSPSPDIQESASKLQLKFESISSVDRSETFMGTERLLLEREERRCGCQESWKEAENTVNEFCGLFCLG